MGNMTISVSDPTPVITGERLVVDSGGGSLTYQIEAMPAGSDYTATGLPAGLTFDASAGVIAGTPLQSGIFDVQLSATTPFGIATSTLRIRVREVVVWGGYDMEPPDTLDLADVVSVAAGGTHTLALKSDGTVVGWGWGWEGEADPPPGLTGVVAIAAGGSESYGGHSLALLGEGTVVGWGGDPYGQATPPPGLDQVVAIAAGASHSLALRVDGTVVAWGDNYSGQLNVPPGLTNVVAIAAGAYHNLALRADGVVVGWGQNWSGEIDTPQDLGSVAAIAAGEAYSLALLTDGTVVQWGTFYSAPDENDDWIDGYVPSDLVNVTQVTAGRMHSVALKSDGSVVVWGDNFNGQWPIPVPISDGVAVSSGSGGDHTCVLRSLTSTRAPKLLLPGFGLSYVGYPVRIPITAGGEGVSFAATGLPTGVTMDPLTGLLSGQPTDVPGVYEISITATNTHGSDTRNFSVIVVDPIATITSPRDVQMAGTSLYYRIETMFPASSYSATGLPQGVDLDPVTGEIRGTPLLAGIYDADVTAHTTVGATTARVTFRIPEVVAWGSNSSGQSQPPDGLSDVVSLAAGTYHSLALKSDHSIVAWGNNSSGQSSPPPGLIDAVALAAGDIHSLALRSDGTVIGWGSNGSNRATPPSDLSEVAAIAAGAQHSLALTTSGRLIGWGGNTNGQINVPSQAVNVVAIAAAGNHSMALRADGSVIAWGLNSSGQCNVPTGIGPVRGIAAGSSHSLALLTNGTVVAWGANSGGKASVPADLTDVVEIAATSSQSIALKQDGSVVVWGSGQVAPSTLDDVIMIAGGTSHALALRALPSTPQPLLASPPVIVSFLGFSSWTRVPVKGLFPLLSADSLPSGLEANAANAEIAGTPGQSGMFAVNLTSALASGETSQRTTHIFVREPSPVLLGSSLVRGVIDQVLEYQVSSVPAGRTFIATDLPPGLMIDLDTGLVNGIPQAPGIFESNVLLETDFGSVSGAIEFRVADFRGLTSGGLQFTHGGDAIWTMQSEVARSGQSEAVWSGVMGDSNASWFETTIQGPGALSYWRSVSSESNYDFLVVTVGGIEVERVSGEVAWGHVAIEVPSGNQKIRWTYQKDSSVSWGRDSGFVSEISFAPASGFSIWNVLV